MAQQLVRSDEFRIVYIQGLAQTYLGHTLDTNGVGGCSSAGGVLPGSAALTPALSQWALIALTLLIASVGFMAMRRRDG